MINEPTPSLRHPLMQSFRKQWVLWLMILPTICFFILFSYLPMAGIYFAFSRFNFQGGLFGSPFVGLDNFQYLFKSGILWNLTRNTILYNIAFILVGNFVQMVCALFFNELHKKWFTKTTQSVIFLPYFVSMVLVGVFSYNLLNIDNGFINSALKALGMATYNFYIKADAWPPIIVAVNVWKGLGYGSIIYLSALTSIDPGYYEAARIDGATKWQQVRCITWPMLKPTLMILIMFSLGGILKGQFDLFYQLIGKNGLLYSTTDIIDTYVYRSLTVNFDIGMGSAAGVYQSVFGLILVLTVNTIVRKVNDEYALF